MRRRRPPKIPSNVISLDNVLRDELDISEDATAEPPTFDVRLSEYEGSDVAGGGGGALPDMLETEPLSADKVERLCARAEDLEQPVVAAFNQRPETMPAPKTGERLNLPFPPPPEDRPEIEMDEEALAQRAREQAGPVKIDRFYPEGVQSHNPVAKVAVTFNQPMVSVGTLDDLESQECCVKMEPEVPGRWRWTGTTTCQFEPDPTGYNRLPYATDFRLWVEAGTESALGNTLEEEFSFAFSTALPQLIRQKPSQYRTYRRSGLSSACQTLTPTFFAGYNQFVDPDALLAMCTVTADGNPVGGALALVPQEEVKADDELKWEVSAQKSNGGDRTWFAFRAAEPLPNDSLIQVAFGPNVPSDEGPLTAGTLSFSFRTYPPLRLTANRPDHHSPRPGSSVSLRFTNPLDQTVLDKSMFSIEPEVPFIITSSGGSGDVVVVTAETAATTTYVITCSEEVMDIHEQLLQPDRTFTFTTDNAYIAASITGPSGVITLDPTVDEPYYAAVVYGYDELRVRLFQVSPEDYLRSPQKNAYEYFKYQDTLDPLQIGTCVHDAVVPVDLQGDAPGVFSLDLRAHMQFPDECLGQLYVMVEPTEEAFQRIAVNNHHGGTYLSSRRIAHAWVQSTRLGITGFHSEMEGREQNLVWISDLQTGDPVEGATVAIAGGVVADAGTTDAAGVSAVAMTTAEQDTYPVIASLGNDAAFATCHFARKDPRQHVMKGFTDRNLYKPNETVMVKGYVRYLDIDAETGATAPTYPEAGTEVTWECNDPRGVKLGDGSVEINAFGAILWTLVLPDNMNLGTSWVYFKYQGQQIGLVSFETQEFRKPEFKVSAAYRPTTHHVSGIGTAGFAIATASANYFAGGPLSNASVNWRVTATKGSYQPPGWAGYNFQEQRRWWTFSNADDNALGSWSHAGKTDADGDHQLQIDYLGNVIPSRPIVLSCAANVQDANFQTLAGSTSILVHPSDLYVGFKMMSSWGNAGDPLNFSVVVTDIDGNLVGDAPITVGIKKRYSVREENDQGVAKWVTKEESEEISWVSAADAPLEASITPEDGGNYTFTLSVTDAHDRPNQAVASAYVRGGMPPPKTGAKVTTEAVQVMPDKECYEAGETAQILVLSPFAPAEGMLTVRSSGVVHTQRFRMEEEATALEVVVDDAWIPSFMVTVDLVSEKLRVDSFGQPKMDDPKRVCLASGSQSCSVSLGARTLTVVATPEHSLAVPGQETSCEVVVTDSSGSPVEGAEVAVIVVDDAVLSLTGYALSNPVVDFYPHRSANTMSFGNRSTVVLLSETEIEDMKAAIQAELKRQAELAKLRLERETESASLGRRCRQRCRKRCACRAAVCETECRRAEEEGCCRDDGGCLDCESDDDSDGGDFDEDAPMIAVRKNFESLAVFADSVATDGDGKASVSYTLPDNLTSYRVWAFAATQACFGFIEEAVTAQLPLMVRPSPPRFLNFGDECEVNLVLQNQTEGDLTVYVGFRCANAALMGDHTGGYKVAMPAAARGAVAFPVTTNLAGTARFQFVASAGEFADAAEVEIPVYTPATSEAFATYGDIAGEADVVLQPVQAPSDAIPFYGGIEVSTASTALQSLTDAFIYLWGYPNECSEQISSRVMAVVALKDVLQAFDVEDIPSEEEMQTKLAADMKQLLKCQHTCGAFGFWSPEFHYINPFVSVHISHTVARALQKGFDVPELLVTRCRAFLADINYWWSFHWWGWYTLKARNSIRAYALYTRMQFGEDVGDQAAGLYRSETYPDDLTMEALGWLASCMGSSAGAGGHANAIKAIFDIFRSRVTETAETANFVTSYGDDGSLVMLHSDRRTDAILLDAWLACFPDDAIISKIAKGLLAHKKKGRWGSTQENCFVLLALDHYFRVREAEEPAFDARVWYGEVFAGAHRFEGRTTETAVINVPMEHVLDQGDTDLVLQREGAGRLYYRIGMKYAPSSLRVDAANYGFAVSRAYFGVASPDDAFQDDDGAWHLKLGAQIRVRVWMTATERRYHVALVDKLPAGLEPLNPALKGTPAVEAGPSDLENLDSSDSGDIVINLSRGPGRRSGGHRAWSPWNWRYTPPGRWFEHQNLRDERTEAFCSLLWPGKYYWDVVCNATSAGRFVVPPAKAEEMYSPENFGRSATDTVFVEKME